MTFTENGVVITDDEWGEARGKNHNSLALVWGTRIRLGEFNIAERRKGEEVNSTRTFKEKKDGAVSYRRLAAGRLLHRDEKKRGIHGTRTTKTKRNRYRLGRKISDPTDANTLKYVRGRGDRAKSDWEIFA